MNKKLHWGLRILAILIGLVFIVIGQLEFVAIDVNNYYFPDNSKGVNYIVVLVCSMIAIYGILVAFSGRILLWWDTNDI